MSERSSRGKKAHIFFLILNQIKNGDYLFKCSFFSFLSARLTTRFYWSSARNRAWEWIIAYLFVGTHYRVWEGEREIVVGSLLRHPIRGGILSIYTREPINGRAIFISYSYEDTYATQHMPCEDSLFKINVFGLKTVYLTFFTLSFEWMKTICGGGCGRFGWHSQLWAACRFDGNPIKTCDAHSHTRSNGKLRARASNCHINKQMRRIDCMWQWPVRRGMGGRKLDIRRWTSWGHTTRRLGREYTNGWLWGHTMVNRSN